MSSPSGKVHVIYFVTLQTTVSNMKKNIGAVYPTGGDDVLFPFCENVQDLHISKCSIVC